MWTQVFIFKHLYRLESSDIRNFHPHVPLINEYKYLDIPYKGKKLMGGCSVAQLWCSVAQVMVQRGSINGAPWLNW
jgi:hypothetical protein